MATVPVPDYGPDSILLRVHAAGLNPSNYKMNPSVLPFMRHLKKWVIGYDVSGVVLAVGASEACNHARVGDDVYGFAAGSGSLAEYAVMPCSASARKPNSLSHAQAAGLPVAALTSLEALQRGNVKQGDKVLVIGASGGCGIFGVEMAKILGAEVVGVCSTRNVDFVQGLGADEVVDYRSAEQMAQLHARLGEFDMIYDTVTSFAPEDPNYEPETKPLLKQDGLYVAINGMVEDWLRMVAEWIVKPLTGIRLQREGYELFLLTPTASGLQQLAQWFDEGKLSDVRIDSTFVLDSNEQLLAAFDRMKSRRTVGKIILTLP